MSNTIKLIVDNCKNDLLAYNINMPENSKNPKPAKKDKQWQEKIEKNVKKEKIELDHPKGKERFESAIEHAKKK